MEVLMDDSNSSIFWTDWNKREVSGHMSPLPKIGDILKCKMKSGKIATFEFSEINAMKDPKDQFFAKVSDLDYE